MQAAELIREITPKLPIKARAAAKVAPPVLRTAGRALAATPGWVLASAAILGFVAWRRRAKAQ